MNRHRSWGPDEPRFDPARYQNREPERPGWDDTRGYPPVPPGYPPIQRAADPDPVPEPAPPELPGPREATGEPVLISQAVTVILGAIVSAGWAVIPDQTINAVSTLIWVVASVVGSFLARGRVKPLKGGLWAQVEDYVAELVAAEMDRRGPP